MTLCDGTWHLNLLNCLSYMVNAHESWSHGGFSSFTVDELTSLGKEQLTTNRYTTHQAPIPSEELE